MKKKNIVPVNNYPGEKLIHLAETLKKNRTILTTKNVTAGFDGFVDNIVRIIKNKPLKKQPVFFTTKNSFGNYILEKQGTGFSVELEEISTRPGGNMPIMANAMSRLGILVNCVGALGYPDLHPVFKTLSGNCKLYSFTRPGTSTAVEFNDGKMILGEMRDLNNTRWQTLKDRIGIAKMIDLYKNSELLCIVNWAEIDASDDIWRGLLTDVFPQYKNLQKQPAFFDLSDFSKRGDIAIKAALKQLKEFSRYTNVLVGLNRNEATLLYRLLYKETAQELKVVAQKIFLKLSIETLILHSPGEVIAVNKDGVYACKSFFTKHPKISTGAGDNFNAGFCAARLMQLDIESSLLFASAVAGLYVRTGTSQEMNDVIKFLENHHG